MQDTSTVEAVQRSLGRLEGKMDILLQNMNQHLMEDTARFDRITNRQDKLEGKLMMLIGKISGAVVVITLVAKEAVAYFLK